MTIIYYLLCIFALNVLVFVHELFHFWAAKLLKIKSTEFAVGFGPTILAYQKMNGKRSFFWFPKKEDNKIDTYEMSYHLKLIPLGGYVLFGRSAKENGKNVLEDYLYVHKPWKRIIVAAAGPIGNFVFAFILAMVLLATQFSFTPNQIEAVAPGSHAESISLKKGDVITEINGTKITNVEDIKKTIPNQKELCIRWERFGSEMNDCSEVKTPSKDFKIGVTMGLSLVELPQKSFLLIKNITQEYLSVLFQTILHLKVENLSGPVGIVDTMQSTITNYAHFISILIVVNIALAVANLVMPFTITDGGRIILDILAILFRKNRFPSKYLDLVSVLLLFTLFIFTLYLDISRIFS